MTLGVGLRVNRTELRAGLGDDDLDFPMFTGLAPTDKCKSLECAQMLTDNLCQIVALARVYKVRAKKNLEKEPEEMKKLRASGH